MNIRKQIDYSAMFAVLDGLMASELPQMELYCGIGKVVSSRLEKGAAVMAAEYLRHTYPDVSGFSPRNLRRMREFYRTYEDAPELLIQAMTIGWTQNVIILEADLSLQEKLWYIQAVRRFGWSKLTLLAKIKSGAHTEITLDFPDEVCYTDKNNSGMKHKSNDKDSSYLPQSNGRVCAEVSGEKSWIGEPVSHRARHQYQVGWKFVLSSGPPQAGRTLHRLRSQNDLPTGERSLRSVRFPDWDRSGRSAEYAPDMRRRLRRKMRLLVEFAHCLRRK